MVHIPPKIRAEIDTDQFYKTCALFGQHGHVCEGRITMEHAIIYAGSEYQKIWAIVPVCAHGHGVDQFHGDPTVSKELRVWVALNRASDDELIAISKVPPGYIHERDRLNKIYGPYRQIVPSTADIIKPQEKDPQTKRDWYLITAEDKAMIQDIRKFNELALGIMTMPREVVRLAIENQHLQVKEQAAANDPKLFKKIWPNG